MEIFKCRICGDPCLSSTKPSYCPFCGAPGDYIILAEDSSEEESLNLTEVSKANLEHALLIENNNTLFYSCACEVAMTAGSTLMFEALYKIEREHASIIRKMLNLPKPSEEEDNRGRCHALEASNIKEAYDREKRAIDFYSRAAEVAAEPRVKEVFTALTEVEKTHVELIGKVIGEFTCITDNTIV